MKQENLIKLIFKYLDDKKALNISVLNLLKLSSISDYFIIATGINTPHLKALYDGIQFELKNLGLSCYDRNGIPDSGWLIIDIQGIMIHIFEQKQRDYYNLELLWKDASIVKVEL